MAPPFTLLALDHIVLRARDPERLERFYREVLGCSLERRQPKIALTQLRAGLSLIDILPAEAVPAPGNVDHFCLRVSPFDGEAIKAHLTACGVTFGEVALRFGADGRGPSIYLDDPEGNRVELKGPPEAAPAP